MLLTGKLSMFLPGFNEKSGVFTKILPVSSSFWSSLKFLGITLFLITCKVVSEKLEVSVNGIL